MPLLVNPLLAPSDEPGRVLVLGYDSQAGAFRLFAYTIAGGEPGTAAAGTWEELGAGSDGSVLVPSSAKGVACWRKSSAGAGMLWVCGPAEAGCTIYDPVADAWIAGPALPVTSVDGLDLTEREDDSTLFAVGADELGNSAVYRLVDGDEDTQASWQLLSDPAAPAPHAPAGSRLRVDAGGEALVLALGSAREAVWRFELGEGTVPGAWTQLTGADPGAKGPKLSGTLQIPGAAPEAVVRVVATGRSGYSNATKTDASGAFELGDLPAEELHLSVALQPADLGFPSPVTTFWDLGVVGPFTADATLDLALPAPQLERRARSVRATSPALVWPHRHPGEPLQEAPVERHQGHALA